MDKEIQNTYRQIKNLTIQGATAIAKSTIIALQHYGVSLPTSNSKLWRQRIKSAAYLLLSARPTEPMAQNGVKYILSYLTKTKNTQLLKQQLNQSAKDFLNLLTISGQKIAQSGQTLIKTKDNVFTHCHSWVVEQILIKAKQSGKRFFVYNTETRPLFQGRITARQLLKANIPVTMVADSSAGFLISHYSGEELMMDKIIVGADALLADGTVINKIGSFTIALVAKQEKVPIYIAAPLLKFYPYSKIKIEQRSPTEIWPRAPKKLKIINFAFDSIPAKYISGIICEAGIIKPTALKQTVKRLYPWLLKEK